MDNFAGLFFVIIIVGFTLKAYLPDLAMISWATWLGTSA
jgi:hypothetical protein